MGYPCAAENANTPPAIKETGNEPNDNLFNFTLASSERLKGFLTPLPSRNRVYHRRIWFFNNFFLKLRPFAYLYSTAFFSTTVYFGTPEVLLRMDLTRSRTVERVCLRDPRK